MTGCARERRGEAVAAGGLSPHANRGYALRAARGGTATMTSNGMPFRFALLLGRPYN